MKWLGKTIFMYAGFIVLFVFYYFASPDWAAWYLRAMFDGSGYSRSKDFPHILDKVEIIRDIDYGSAYPNGRMDVIRPKNQQGRLPVIFWMHGGAYVGGDKQDTEPYGVCLAGRGYVVVNMNYALAPESRYPTPLMQMGEAYCYVAKHAIEYGIDMDNIYFGGDSAGAQIVSVFVNAETCKDYADNLGLTQVVAKKDTIRGTLLFCGPYDMRKLADIDAPIVGFMLNRAAWAYMKDKKWYDSKAGQLNSLPDKVSMNFPPAFLTDGNTGSFEGHARSLERALKAHGVPVYGVYYPRGEKILMHEYQFHMREAHAQKTFEQAIEFLRKTTLKKIR